MTTPKSEIIQNNKRPKFTPGDLVVSTTDLLVVLVSDEQDGWVHFSGTVVYVSDLAAKKYDTFVGQHVDSWSKDGFSAFNDSVKINP